MVLIGENVQQREEERDHMATKMTRLMTGGEHLGARIGKRSRGFEGRSCLRSSWRMRRGWRRRRRTSRLQSVPDGPETGIVWCCCWIEMRTGVGRIA